MQAQSKKAVPGMPLAALDAIADPNTRSVLRALIDAHHVRNGQSGNGEDRFVTAKEVGLVSGHTAMQVMPGRQAQGGAAQSGHGLTRLDLARILNDLQAQIIESPLFKELGSHIALVDNAVVKEIENRSAAIRAEAQARIDALLAEALARGTAILEERNVRIAAESALAQSITTWSAVTQQNVAAIQTEITARSDAISAEASARTTLAARVGEAESGIVTLNRVTASQASQSNVLVTRVGNLESNVSTLDTTSANQASSLSLLTTRTGNVETAVSNERDTRLSQDNAIASAVQTVWAALGGNAGLIQGGASVTVNLSGAAAQRWNQVQAALKDANGNLIASSAIKQSTDVLVDKQGQIEAKWVLNLDSGGNAVGYRQAGFGISGSNSQNGPQFAFGVRADQFWIASPGDSGQETAPGAKLPFIVKTGNWIDGRGYPQGPGVYLNDLFVTTAKIGVAQINSAMIADAQVGTLKIGANAVTVPFTQTFPGETQGQGVGTPLAVASGVIVIDAPAMVYAATTGLIAYGAGWCSANSSLQIDGTQVCFGGGDEAWVNACHSGGKFIDTGPFPRQVNVTLYFNAESRARIISPTIFIMGAKR
jgi:hypothetical protein